MKFGAILATAGLLLTLAGQPSVYLVAVAGIGCGWCWGVCWAAWMADV